MIDEGVRLSYIGDIKRLPEKVRMSLHESCEATKGCNTVNLVLAINYGARNEICRATQRILDLYKQGESSDITESLISQHLDTAPFRGSRFINPNGWRKTHE